MLLPGEPFRPRPPKPAFPEVSWEKNRIWIWDATHFTRCKRVAYAIVDVVTRYWIGYLLSSEQTDTAGAAADRPRARGIRTEYNTVRLHASIGYLTPDDEHHGRGRQIRRARLAGMRRARAERIEQDRKAKS